MIAVCQPAPAEWDAAAPTADRSGSLRRIDDIVSELLAGYCLAVPAANTPLLDDPASNVSPAGVSSAGAAGTTVASVEMLLICQR